MRGPTSTSSHRAQIAARGRGGSQSWSTTWIFLLGWTALTGVLMLQSKHRLACVRGTLITASAPAGGHHHHPSNQLQQQQQPSKLSVVMRQQQPPRRQLGGLQYASTAQHPTAVGKLQLLQQSSAAVDVVVLWVNGSDPQLQQELLQQQVQQQKQMAAAPALAAASLRWFPSGSASIPTAVTAADASAAAAASASAGDSDDQAAEEELGEDTPECDARFDSGRDELRFSLRSLQQHLPWFRHLYLVTNGQVPSWLDVNSPRVTVVPHTTIFPDTGDLPTFSSWSIQANVANIPGLSERFILMDDDFFFTAAWDLSDFLSPDGSQVLTGTKPISDLQPDGSLHVQTLINLDATFTARLGKWERYVPRPGVRLLRQDWLEELKQKLPELWKDTSARHVRSPHDMNVMAAYQFYIEKLQPGHHPRASDADTLQLSISDSVARHFLLAAQEDIQSRVDAGDADATAIVDALTSADNDEFLQGVAEFEARMATGTNVGAQFLKQAQSYTQTLFQAWSTPGQKMVCLDDEISDAAAAARPLLNPVVKIFLETLYSQPSQFELPAGATNGCSKRLPATEFGVLPSQAHYAYACGTLPAKLS